MAFGKSIKLDTKIFFGVLGVVTCTVVFLASVLSWRMNSELETFGRESITGFMDTMERTIEMQNAQIGASLRSDIDYAITTIGAKGTVIMEPSDVPTQITNQETNAIVSAKVPRMSVQDMGIIQDFTPFAFVSEHKRATSFDCTLFAVMPDKMVRIATTLKDEQGQSAINSYIPATSPIFTTVASGNEFQGTAQIEGKPYMVIYRPMRDAHGAVTSAIFVGTPILSEAFTKMIAKSQVGGLGYTFIFDSKGKRLVHPSRVGTNVLDDSYGKLLFNAKRDFVEWEYNGDKVGYILRYEPWNLSFGVALTREEMLRDADTLIQKWAAGAGAIALVLAALLVTLLTREVTRPMQALAAFAATVAAGDFNAVMEYPANDAIGRTIKGVNAMVADLKNKLGFTQGVLHGITIPFAVCGIDEKVMFTNQALVDLVKRGGTTESWKGKPLDQYVYGRSKQDMVTRRCLRERQAIRNVEIALTAGDGSVSNVLIDAAPLFDLDHNLIGSFTLYSDITDLRKQQLAVEAQRDIAVNAAANAEVISRELMLAADMLAGQVREASSGSEIQRSRTTETATAMEQMNASVMEVAQSAGSAAQNTDLAKAKAEEGAAIVAEVITAIDGVRKLALDLQSSMDALTQ